MIGFYRKRKESIDRIISLAWPLIIANSFWNLQLTIDRIFLGISSTESLAAAVAVMGVFWTPMALLQQTAAYVTTFVAQYYGAKEFKNIGPAVWHALFFSVVGGLLFMLQNFVCEIFFSSFGHSEAVTKLEIAYFQSLSYSAMPTAILATVSGFYTGLGNTGIIILFNTLGLIGNAVFDYLLIFGNYGFPELGIAGAGYATAIGTWIAAVGALLTMFNQKNESLYGMFSGWRFNGDLFQRLLKFGVPSGLQWALEGIAFTVFLIIVGRMQNGDAALASSGIVITIMMLSAMPVMGIAQAASVLVGQHLGEKKPEEAVKDVWNSLYIGLCYILFMAITFLIFPEFYMNWFYNDKNKDIWDQVAVMVPTLLALMALFTLFDCGNFIFSFSLKGAGDTRFVSLVSLTMPWPFFVLPTWLVRNWSDGIYWAWGSAAIYTFFLAFTFWRRFEAGKWKTMNVIHG